VAVFRKKPQSFVPPDGCAGVPLLGTSHAGKKSLSFVSAAAVSAMTRINVQLASVDPRA